MNGAELLVRTASEAGIEVCFANAGTTEMPILLALDGQVGIKPILGLFEGVCTGAADGYGRLNGKPAMALLHLGPGFANGIANLHNARRAQSPVLNVIGEHATWHRAADAPLAMHIEGLASTVSGWMRTVSHADGISKDLAEAITSTMFGQISSLVVPNDLQWAQVTDQAIHKPQFSFDSTDISRINTAAELLKAHDKTALILGPGVLRGEGLNTALRIQAKTGCALFADSFPPCMERGEGLPEVVRIPYFPEPAMELMGSYEAVVLIGTKEPVTFFGYPGLRSTILSESQKKARIGMGRENPAEALEALADSIDAPPLTKVPKEFRVAKQQYHLPPEGPLSPEAICQTLAALFPEESILVDEGLTTAFPFYPMTKGLPRHIYLSIAGGSIGYGMPCATGAAIACPDRTVINFQADGSAMYTVQSLWTQARERLRVITLLCSNRSYHIIRTELQRVGITSPGINAKALIDIDNPGLNWVKIAEGMGVPALSAKNVDELVRSFRAAIAGSGPYLIDMAVTRG